jgi:hypothetical protein
LTKHKAMLATPVEGKPLSIRSSYTILAGCTLVIPKGKETRKDV